MINMLEDEKCHGSIKEKSRMREMGSLREDGDDISNSLSEEV